MSADRGPEGSDSGDGEHIWRTAAPRPVGEPTRGARWIGLGFVVLLVVAVVVVLLLLAGGLVSTDAPYPDRPFRDG